LSFVEISRCRAQALQQCDHERFDIPAWSYLRALESAIVKAVEAGEKDRRADTPSTSGGDHECLRLLANFGECRRRCEFILSFTSRRRISNIRRSDLLPTVLDRHTCRSTNFTLCKGPLAASNLLPPSNRARTVLSSRGELARTPELFHFANVHSGAIGVTRDA